MNQLNIVLLSLGALQGVIMSLFLLRRNAAVKGRIYFCLFLIVVGLQLTFKAIAKSWLWNNAQHLFFIASDNLQGRKAGTAWERLAAEYLASHYQGLNIPPLTKNKGDDNTGYFQHFEFNNGPTAGTSQNVLAYLEGNDPVLKNEVIIISAHYDHLGTGAKTANDSIFNGAADDGSGTVALLELAESFQSARNQGVKFKRSIIFFHAGGEESGLLGSTHYVAKDPLIPLSKTSAIINLDGIGGTDKPQAPNGSNYVYLLQNDSTSLQLYEIAQSLNNTTGTKLDLLKPANPERFVSDNKPFEYELVPSLYFSTGLTEHYHQVSDHPSTIHYEHMTKITKLIFATAWELANTGEVKSTRNAYTKTGKYFCAPCGCASDKKSFDAAGTCPDCRMTLQPSWKRK